MQAIGAPTIGIDWDSRLPSVKRFVLGRHLDELRQILAPHSSASQRERAIVKLGQTTIPVALTFERPTLAPSRSVWLRIVADYRLFDEAWQLANDLSLPAWYRHPAYIVAAGMASVVALGLSPQRVPQGIDFQIWKSCGTTPFRGHCDDPLCNACAKHDLTRDLAAVLEAYGQ